MLPGPALSLAPMLVPVPVVHGSADALVPPTLGRALFEHASAEKRLVLVDGGSHCSTNAVGARQYRQALRELFGLGAGAAPVTAAE